jgi:hypothetical protein
MAGVMIRSVLVAVQNVLVCTDDKPWKMARLGRGEAASALVRAVGGDDINLVQHAYYNGLF